MEYRYAKKGKENAKTDIWKVERKAPSTKKRCRRNEMKRSRELAIDWLINWLIKWVSNRSGKRRVKDFFLNKEERKKPMREWGKEEKRKR